MSTAGATRDRFADIKQATLSHLHDHGCSCYPYSDGSLLATLAAAAGAGTVVELGTALGYSAAWFAGTGARVHTIDRDSTHSREARRQLDRHGLAGGVEFHTGDGIDILQTMPAGRADLAFFDGFMPTSTVITALANALRPGGLLIAGNMTLGGDTTQVRAFLETWQHSDLGETVLAVKPRNS
jgi:predicted O-methyltransferase YrrM